MVSSDLAKGKGDIDQVRITVRDEEEEAITSPANPQFFLYFYFLFFMAMCVFCFSPAIPGVLRSRKQSPFKPPSEVYFLMTIVTISVTLLASALLIFTSYYLKNYMRNIHYTILKSVGMLSGFLVIFSTGCVVFVTSNKLNWRYSFMGLFFVVILALYYVVWKYALVHQPNYKEISIDWSIILLCLFSGSVPLSVKLLTIIPKKLLWVDFLIIFAQVSTLVPFIVKRCKSRTQGTSLPVIQQVNQTEAETGRRQGGWVGTCPSRDKSSSFVPPLQTKTIIIHSSVATCKI